MYCGVRQEKKKEDTIYVINMNVDKNFNHDPEEGHFLVDRHSPLGNPFKITKKHGRDEACEKYEDYFYGELIDNTVAMEYLTDIIAYYEKHDTVYLLCWCSPDRCHAETIKKYIQDSVKRTEKKVTTFATGYEHWMGA